MYVRHSTRVLKLDRSCALASKELIGQNGATNYQDQGFSGAPPPPPPHKMQTGTHAHPTPSWNSDLKNMVQTAVFCVALTTVLMLLSGTGFLHSRPYNLRSSIEETVCGPVHSHRSGAGSYRDVCCRASTPGWWSSCRWNHLGTSTQEDPATR